ncbi:hypothetical protein MAR_024534 [Mya arenaria]|uniref:EF-hand domain-containing protein n=1 Tax=Mya arenaria TaxID=6604 RepID=A0ABY7DU98_MYAAR|nr:uncharacterized protein LOC128228908 [Mya arenaria]XP_052812548.1 uncharacterized protein LOC128240094 [Mya arenaria]XP_052812549.1 uncharacterized protein LOC128240094 [Mya arenaria]WAR00162.1 hypothetical protein MAR_024534 [Mya arenaria]
MMPVNFLGFIPMLTLALLVVIVAGRSLESNVSGAEQMQNDGLIIMAEDGLRKYNGPAVHHFARHGLCNHSFGKVRFFRALQKHFHNISDDMKIAFVLDICKRRDHMLTKWVQEIFDKDGDGYISHFEREIDR